MSFGDHTAHLCAADHHSLSSAVQICLHVGCSVGVQCSKQFIPVGEVGSIVGLELQVVEVVMWGPSVQPKGDQPVGGPGEVVA